jgi:hypothetical protein
MKLNIIQKISALDPYNNIENFQAVDPYNVNFLTN